MPDQYAARPAAALLAKQEKRVARAVLSGLEFSGDSSAQLRSQERQTCKCRQGANYHKRRIDPTVHLNYCPGDGDHAPQNAHLSAPAPPWRGLPWRGL